MHAHPTPAGPPVASLRVYEPLSAFPESERRRWTAHLETVADPDAIDELERAESWLRVIRGPTVNIPRTDLPHPRVLRIDDQVFVCPPQLPLRCAAAGRAAFPTLPPVLATAATADLDKVVQTTSPGHDLRLRTLVAGWQVPTAWLVAVGAQDQDDAAPDRSVPGRHRLLAEHALTRIHRVLRALRGLVGDVDIVGEIEEMAHWLQDFDSRSWLEIDVRSVLSLLPGEAEQAVDDVRLGVECLLEGDTTGVAAAYQRIRRRADRLQAVSRAS